MKKGFTIIELLAVLAILTLMSLMIIPAVFSSLDKAKEKEYHRIKSLISEASESYYLKYQEQFQNATLNQPKYVSLQQLKEETYLEDNLKNPITEQNLNYKNLVKIFKNANGFMEYIYTDGYFESSILPNTTISIGSSYSLRESDILTDSEKEIEVLVDGNKVTLPYTLPTSTSKTYIITYQITNPYETTSLTRNITVS